ncbi:MAG: DUF423 domain-containing protein [Reichenbachiella sp.]
MNRKFKIGGAFFGLSSVILGAFGAHAFKAVLEASNRIEVYNTGVKYLMFHAVVLLVIGFATNIDGKKWGVISGYMFIAGTILFSGSLFLICLLDISVIGIITPIGGVLLVIGWVSLLVAIIKEK